jgi:hypothetical protein
MKTFGIVANSNFTVCNSQNAQSWGCSEGNLRCNNHWKVVVKRQFYRKARNGLVWINE